jgi:pimeloyl-ACP methyl ester carboxylesterase
LLRATEYSWADRLNFFRGILASMRLLLPEILSLDLTEQAPRLKVPVYFLEGRHDREAPSVLAEQYLQALEAPRKTLVWFERSAHLVNVEEAEAFNRFFVDRLLRETWEPAQETAPSSRPS